MVNDYRIKMITIGSFAVNGSVIAPIYSQDNNINGEIIKIKVANCASPGSIWLGESGAAGTIFVNKNNLASGTAPIEWYPLVYGAENILNGANAVGSPAWFSVVNAGPIYAALSGCTSGTATKMGPITVYYR